MCKQLYDYGPNQSHGESTTNQRYYLHEVRRLAN